MYLERLLLILGVAGVVNGFILGVFLLLMRKGNILANQLLGFLLLAASAKSSYAVIMAGVDINWKQFMIIQSVSLVGYYSLAPLVLLYILALTKQKRYLCWYDGLHFIPAIFILIASIKFLNISIWIGQIQIFIYIAIIVYFFNKTIKSNRTSSVISEKVWIRNLIFALIAFWLSVSFLIITDFNKYYLIELSILFTAIIYILIYSALKAYWFMIGNKQSAKTQKDNELNDADSLRLLNKLTKVMEDEKLYENPEISLPKLAKQIDTSPHRLSEVINKKTGKNFTDFINEYRIVKAKEMLIDPHYGQYKIAAIAFDCGFNTLSTFNLAFKKNTGKTPSEFRESLVTLQT